MKTIFKSVVVVLFSFVSSLSFAQDNVQQVLFPGAWQGSWSATSSTTAKSFAISVAGIESWYMARLSNIPAGSSLSFRWKGGFFSQDYIQFLHNKLGGWTQLATKNGGAWYNENIALPQGTYDIRFRFVRGSGGGGNSWAELENVILTQPGPADLLTISANTTTSSIQLMGTFSKPVKNTIAFVYCPEGQFFGSVLNTFWTTQYSTSLNQTLSGFVSGQTVCFQVTSSDVNGIQGQTGVLTSNTLPRLSVYSSPSYGTYSVSWNYPSSGWKLQIANAANGPWTNVNLAGAPQGDYELKGAMPYRYYYYSWRVAPYTNQYFRLTKDGQVVMNSALSAKGSSGSLASKTNGDQIQPAPIQAPNAGYAWEIQSEEISLDAVSEEISRGLLRKLGRRKQVSREELDRAREEWISEIASQSSSEAEDFAPSILFSDRLLKELGHGKVIKTEYVPVRKDSRVRQAGE